nr:very low-density lipoprotein receptor-like [Parasteatoda tepidariorum]
MLPHKITGKMSIIFLFLNLFSILTIISCDSSSQIPGVKPENIRTRLFKNKIGPCSYYQFRCQNDKCVERGDFCNGRDDCGDNSDEWYCRTSSCRDGKGIACGNGYYDWNCIPEAWECDGIKDCTDGRDERRCEDRFESGVHPDQILRAKFYATNWILNGRNNASHIQKWGGNIARTAVAYYFSESSNQTKNKNYNDELAYELSIRLLSKFALRNMAEL